MSGLPTGVQTPNLCTGQTTAGNTNWQANDSTSLYLEVNTAACGFTTTPRYQTSLGGDSHQRTFASTRPTSVASTFPDAF